MIILPLVYICICIYKYTIYAVYCMYCPLFILGAVKLTKFILNFTIYRIIIFYKEVYTNFGFGIPNFRD